MTVTTDEPMLRAALRSDREVVVALAASSGLFQPEGAEDVAATFDKYWTGDHPDAVWTVITTGDEVVGVSYLGPEQMANGTRPRVRTGSTGSGPSTRDSATPSKPASATSTIMGTTRSCSGRPLRAAKADFAGFGGRR